MRTYAGALLLSLFALAAGGAIAMAQGSEAPYWAYGYLTPPMPGQEAPPCGADPRPISCGRVGAPPDNKVIQHLPGSEGAFTLAQIAGDYAPADWYPGDHPPMPDIVAHGREKDGLRACGLCHYPNGKGKMENGGVAGLPASYILRQIADFKNGKRRSADARKANTNEMVMIAKALTDAEAKASAEYFASIKWMPYVKVIESATTPKVRTTLNGLMLPIEGETEPLGQRIIEFPENPERTDKLRDPRLGFVAYVPPGSLAKGEALVTTGNGGKTIQCGVCHGADLKGLGDVPGIAGKSPSYTMRQLWDMQQGTRSGEGAQLMKAVVAKLTLDDMIAITAYTSSRTP